jgi:hypothetical protein
MWHCSCAVSRYDMNTCATIRTTRRNYYTHLGYRFTLVMLIKLLLDLNFVHKLTQLASSKLGKGMRCCKCTRQQLITVSYQQAPLWPVWVTSHSSCDLSDSSDTSFHNDRPPPLTPRGRPHLTQIHPRNPQVLSRLRLHSYFRCFDLFLTHPW